MTLRKKCDVCSKKVTTKNSTLIGRTEAPDYLSVLMVNCTCGATLVVAKQYGLGYLSNLKLTPKWS